MEKINKIIAFFVVAFVLLQANLLLAEPRGESVVQGDVSYEQNGSQLIITASHQTIIEYNQFNLAKDEKIKFIQPGKGSALLLRVVDSQDAARINGTVESNGRILLVSPAGIEIGESGAIHAEEAFLAAGAISESDFLNNRKNFSNLEKNVKNLGGISGSKIWLLGQKVVNGGQIQAPKGVIGLVAGNEVRLSEDGDQVLAGLNANQGSKEVGVKNYGKLHAANMAPGETGGKIKVLGHNIILLEGSEIDASGKAGGGEILIGGDLKGENPEISNAYRTFIAADATIRADAMEKGDGGKVIVWSDSFTRYHGSLSARGGPQGGDGGFAEVSGKKGMQWLDGALADLSSVSGTTGEILLDPDTITVVENTGTADINDDGVPGDDLTAVTDLDDIGDFAGLDSIISNDAIDALLAVGDLTLFAVQEVVVDAAIGTGLVGPGTLTFQTAGLEVNADIAFDTNPVFVPADVNQPVIVALAADSNLTINGGNSDDQLLIENGVTYSGALDFSAGNNTVTMGAGSIFSNTPLVFGPGNDTLILNPQSDIQGDVDTGAGNDVVRILSTVTSNVSFQSLDTGDNDDSIFVIGQVAFNNPGPSPVSISTGAGIDIVQLSDGADILGDIDGGADADTLDFTDFATGRSLVLTNPGNTDGFAGTEAIISNGFNNIDVIIGSSASGDSLTGEDDDGAFLLDTNNTYTSTNSLSFSGIESVAGGSNDDTFTFTNAGSLSGSVSGGSDGSDTLIGDNDGNLFNITGVSSGVLVGKTGFFANIENLGGGTGSDIFDLQGGSIESIVGGLGDGDLLQGSGAITNGVIAGAGSTVSPGVSPGVINLGDVTFSGTADYVVELDGTSPGSDPGDHDQLDVTGAVDLAGANLKVSVNFSAVKQDEFVIINNDDVDPVVGTFAGLNEGDSFKAGNFQFSISYVGGDGNDVTLTMIQALFPYQFLPAIINQEQ